MFVHETLPFVGSVLEGSHVIAEINITFIVYTKQVLGDQIYFRSIFRLPGSIADTYRKSNVSVPYNPTTRALAGGPNFSTFLGFPFAIIAEKLKKDCLKFPFHKHMCRTNLYKGMRVEWVSVRRSNSCTQVTRPG